MVEKLISVIQKRNFRTHFGIGNLENHWANEITMTEYVNICPCVAESRKEYDLPFDLKRFLVFESFRGQIKSQKTAQTSCKLWIYLSISLLIISKKRNLSNFMRQKLSAIGVRGKIFAQKLTFTYPYERNWSEMVLQTKRLHQMKAGHRWKRFYRELFSWVISYHTQFSTRRMKFQKAQCKTLINHFPDMWYECIFCDITNLYEFVISF